MATVNGERSTAPTPPPVSDGVLVGNTLYISGHLDNESNIRRDQHCVLKLLVRLTLVQMDGKDGPVHLLVQDPPKVAVSALVNSLKGVSSRLLRQNDTFNSVYRGYFPRGFPARAFLGASALVRGAHFEVLGIAVRRSGTR